jgi:hypothetical protein
MSQNDYTIANQTTPLFRADLNNALQALASNSSGATAPATTYANMTWYDTGTNILKMRSEADDAWINVAYVDQSANAWRVLDNTQVVSTSGTQTGLIGDQTTATWQTGTGTTESLVSPAKVKAAIQALVPPVEQDFVLLSRAVISNNATVEFTAFDGASYDSYMFVFSDVVGPAANNYFFLMKTSSNGGSTYDGSSGNYEYAAQLVDTNGTTYTSAAGTPANIQLSSTIRANMNYSGTLRVFSPHTTERTQFVYHSSFIDSNTRLRNITGSAMRDSASDVDAIQFSCSVGSMQRGTITMYGMRNA